MAATTTRNIHHDPGPIMETFKDGDHEDNLQDQRDEILALRSIFNTEDDDSKLKVLSEVSEDNEGLFTLMITVTLKPTHDLINVDVALPVKEDAAEEVGAAAAMEGSGPPKLPPNVPLNRSVSGRRWQGSYSVKYLSPLYLLATLPPTYPSDESPHVRLACDWLTSVQMTSLSNALDAMSKEACQMPVIFTWVDWLENNMLSHLGITDHLVLQPVLLEAGSADGDTGVVVPWEEDMGEIIASMLRYNKEQMDIEFCQSTHECHVCYDEKLGTQFFRMHDCEHHYCQDCMTAFCEMHVTEGTVEALRCPDRECDAIIPPYIVQAVMGDEAYERWEQLLLQKTLDAMADTVYCPRCNSLVIAEEEEGLHLAHCAVCYFAFCTLCERNWHQGRNCATEEEMLEEIQGRGRRGNMNAAEERRFQELLRKVEDDIASKKQMKKNTMNCPHCKVPVEKIGGCNKMTCKCGKHFCWVCGKQIQGYSHFHTGNCVLFPGQAGPAVMGVIRRPAQGALRIQARLDVNPQLANNRCFCPMCKQVNLKGEDKNNHIKCWNCKTNFCYLCKQRMIGNPMAHFAGGPCTQHS